MRQLSFLGQGTGFHMQEDKSFQFRQCDDVKSAQTVLNEDIKILKNTTAVGTHYKQNSIPG